MIMFNEQVDRALAEPIIVDSVATSAVVTDIQPSNFAVVTVSCVCSLELMLIKINL